MQPSPVRVLPRVWCSLKNDAALPIQGLKTVALFGVNSYDFMSGGLGSGAVNVGYSVDMVTGLKNIGVATSPQLTKSIRIM